MAKFCVPTWLVFVGPVTYVLQFPNDLRVKSEFFLKVIMKEYNICEPFPAFLNYTSNAIIYSSYR